MENRVPKFQELGRSVNYEFSEDLIMGLNKVGYFIKPGSIRFHGNYEGGLFDHSYNVTRHLLDYTKRLDLKWSLERSPVIVGMFHDLCKCFNYQLNDKGKYSTSNDGLGGHGDRSVIECIKLIPDLTLEEEVCIRYHMGLYESREVMDYLRSAIKKFPNLLYVQLADMYSSQIEDL